MTPTSFSVRVAPEEYRALKLAVSKRNQIRQGHGSLSVSEFVREIVFAHQDVIEALAVVLGKSQP
jgi:hypothetical protein